MEFYKMALALASLEGFMHEKCLRTFMTF